MRVKRVAAAALALFLAGCAAKMPPALPTTLKYPDFVYPAVPQSMVTSPQAAAIDRGWRYLQNDDLGSADREFTAVMKRTRAFAPAEAGLGWVALARKDYDRALTSFDMALTLGRDYVPAILGRAQSLLALKRDAEALASFERALAVDSSLVDVRRRVEVLRFRSVQEVIENARKAATAGRLADAREAYRRAIEASPESAFLYRELATLERKQGDLAAALGHFRKAVELDASDAVSWIETGTLLEDQQDFEGAAAAYRRAAEIEASAELTARIAALTEKTREAKLPAEFKAIRESPQITRGELAALIGIRLEPLLRSVPAKQVVMTDIRGHWAASWITLVVNAGIIDAFENHTFQPRQRVRRVDLATAVSRIVNRLAERQPQLRARLSERPTIADMAPAHLNYPAVAVAVSSGVIPLLDGQRFQTTRAVSGAEAIEAVDRLRALSGDVRPSSAAQGVASGVGRQ
jgi:tetratricopeptide (TPR) repeat protein